MFNFDTFQENFSRLIVFNFYLTTSKLHKKYAYHLRKHFFFFLSNFLSFSRLADLSVYVQGHVGGVLEGRPIFCVQAASAECYAYNKVTKHWDQVWSNFYVSQNIGRSLQIWHSYHIFVELGCCVDDALI